MKQVASLQYGVMFKKAFSKPEIFTAFAQDILGITLEIERVETEKSFSPIVGRVNSHFDLFAEDVKNRVIVDIQHERHEDHYDRFLHYHCVALLEQIASSKNYRPELKVFTIVVLTSGDKHKTDVATIDFDPKDLQGKALSEISHKVIYLCPKYVNENTPIAYKEWLEAIDDTLDEEVDESHYHNAIIQQVFNSIEKDSITADERAVMFDEYNEQQFRKKELKESRQEGEIAGVKKGQLLIAKTMLEKGLAKEMIVEMTDLAIEDINAIKFEASSRALSLQALHQ
ncbi:MAG: PD-(D/E)XK nuclease family transposase [Methylococcales bacterium]|nr:PD-(D/E)XK nuclease family transposase [Methylococcales bacterium]